MRGLFRAWTGVRPAAAGVAGEVVLSGRGLVVRRGQRNTIDGVDVDVPAGQVTALVGPNGAGKSTLLGVLAGDVCSCSGEVELQGMPMSRYSEMDRARRRAVLTQHHSVGFPFTAREIVAMGRYPWAGMEGDQDELAVEQAMAETEVTHLAGRRFLELSGGERAQVALARVLAQDTAVLLLDEPTAALDIGHQESVMNLLRRRAAGGRAVVVVLHDLAAAAVHADRVVLLAAGRVMRTGTPADTLRPELLSEVYGCPIDVITHPRTAQPIVLPVRERADLSAGCHRRSPLIASGVPQQS